MIPPAPKRRATRVVGSFDYFEVDRHTLELPSGNTREVHTIRTNDWVAVAAITAEGHMIFVRQHRHGVNAQTIEVAGGIVDPGEAPEVAGPRELYEETGYEGDPPISLGSVHPNPAMQDNRCHFYLVKNARLVARPNNDENEHTEALLMTLDETRRALDEGEISHALAVVGVERALALLKH